MIALLPLVIVFYIITFDSPKCDDGLKTLLIDDEVLVYQVTDSTDRKHCEFRHWLDKQHIEITLAKLYSTYKEDLPKSACWVGYDRTETREIAVAWGRSGRVKGEICFVSMKGEERITKHHLE